MLELGCGAGRILLNSAETGLECVGLDASTEMLDVLREKNPPENVTLVHGRIENFDLGSGRFRLITAPFRGMQHLLDPQSQLAALRNIHRHLTSEGVFVFDVFDPNLAAIAVEEEPEVLDLTCQILHETSPRSSCASLLQERASLGWSNTWIRAKDNELPWSATPTSN